MNVSRSEIIASIRKNFNGALCLRVCFRRDCWMRLRGCLLCVRFVLEWKYETKKGVNGGCGERILQFGPDVMQKWLLVLRAWEQTCAVAPEALSPLWRCSKTGPHRWWQTDVARITSNTEWTLLNCPGPGKKTGFAPLFFIVYSNPAHWPLFAGTRWDSVMLVCLCVLG